MKNKFFALILLPIVLVLSSSSLPADTENHWAFFKGSIERLGVSESSVELPLKISWTYKPEGKSNGFVDWGPVATEGVLYTPDGLNRVIALNAATGEILWKKDLVSNVFSVTLSEDAKILYITTAITTKPSPTLFAIDPKTGDDLWNNMINEQPAVGGMEGAPVIRDGKIYAGYLQYEGHGGVVSYDGLTGKLLWHAEVARFSPYSPVTYADGKLLIGFENRSINCLDAATGKVIWSQQVAELPYAASSVLDKKVYVASGTSLYSMDLRTGQIMWQKTLEGEIGHSSVSIFNKVLYVASHESKVFALNASDGNVVWIKDLQKGSIESSVLIDTNKKILFVGTQENWLVALSLKNGEIKQELKLSEDERGVWKTSPVIYNGRLYIGSLDRTLYALESE